MNITETTACLIARAIQDRQRVQFGLLARSLPPFDTYTFYTALKPELDHLRLALLGFDDVDDRFPKEVAREVESAIQWRNDPHITVPLVVILNPTKQFEKIHSLGLLEPFTDQDLRRAIYRLATDEARNVSNYLQEKVWQVLERWDRSDSQGPMLVAAQLAAFYHALQTQEVATALSYLGLLPDPELRTDQDIGKELMINYKTVEWLSELDNQSFRTLARALTGDGDDFSQTFRKIKSYSDLRTSETLQALTLQEVLKLKNARKAPQPPAPDRRSVMPGDMYLVDQLLKLAAEQNIERQQRTRRLLEEQASRISQMFFRADIPEDYVDEPTEQDEDEEDVFETLVDYETEEEIGRVEKFKEDKDKRHPLHESFQAWLRPLCWGGQVEVDLSSKGEVDKDEVDLGQLLSGKMSLTYKPLRPLDLSNTNSLSYLFQNLDDALAQSGLTGRLTLLFQDLANHRRSLLQYHEQFLYYPQYAVEAREIRSHLRAYLDTYQELSQHLQQVCRQLQEHFPDAIQRATAQFLALDTILVRLNRLSKSPQISVLLTSLHPLHLWKWLQLAGYLYNLPRPLTSKEQEKVRQATSRLPTILNTFVLHPAMYGAPADQGESRLVLAGEIDNPGNEATVGIPYYQPIAEQVSGPDGLQHFATFLRHFLILYPPAQLGLTMVMINPPRMSPILRELAKLHRDREQEIHLDGARVLVFWTKTAVYDEWRSQDEEALQLFREDPRWTLYIDLETRSLENIHKELQRRKIYPHVILLCDPSAAVARSTFRTVQDEATPFGVPVQLTYDQISDTVQIVPAATGGIFDTYAGLRHVLSGDLHRTILGVGNQGAKPADLKSLLDMDPGAHWLAVLDWPQGTLEMPADLGRRLLWLPARYRTLTIHTREQDWQDYWQPKLQSKLDDWQLSGSAADILDHLRELVTVFSNGLLDLIQESPSSYADVFNNGKLAEILAVMAVFNWYRQEHPGLILLPIGGEDFGDWYATGDFENQIPPYYIALWLENGRLHTDLLAIHRTYPPSNPVVLDSELAHLAAFAKAMEALFDEAGVAFILTPLRRALLRERLTAAVFAPSASTSGSPLVQGKQSKAQWATAINRLFDSAYKPSVRLMCIDVALDQKHLRVGLHRIPGQDVDGYGRFQVSVPGGFLQPGSAEVVAATATAAKPPYTSSDRRVEHAPPESADQHITTPSPDIAELVIGQGTRLRRVLDAYGLAIASVDLEKTQVGPRFIRYWVQLMPPAGRLSEIQKCAEDIAREMGSRTVPFIDNIPSQRYIGIDLARDEPQSISLQPALEKLPRSQPDQLLIAAGQSPAGEDVQLDLTRLPHMLVAGQTGSGKTVFLSSLIISLAWCQAATDLQLLLIDPKQMDFGIFGDLPHLVDNRILYESAEAIDALRNLLQAERPRRTELIKQANCPNNLEYNRRHPTQRLPWLVVVIDEFADLILSLSKREREGFEKQVNRLAATGRAAGIHLVIATQRPTTDIITGTIKANITARVSFRLPSQVDSRTILDRPGAENLLGQGDMLVSVDNNVQRLQGYFASYDELQKLLSVLKG